MIINKNSIKSGFGFVLLFILIIILLIPRKILNEHFDVLRGVTSETIYRDTKDIVKYDAAMNDPSFMSTIDDQKDELIMKRCYQIPNTTIEYVKGIFKNKNRPCPIHSFDIITNNFTDVINKVVLDIQNVHDTKVKDLIHGPIYTLIFQVPYYKNDKGEDISLQSFNTSAYKFQPYYDAKNLNTNPTIYYYCIICYGRYDRRWKLAEDDLFKKHYMQMLDQWYSSFEPQCYMVGVGTSTGPFKFAGCASSDAIKDGSYSATCLGPKLGNNLLQNDPNDTKNTRSTYGILYVINNNADSIKRFLFNKDNIQYPTNWKYIHGISVPLRENNNKDVECLSNDNKHCLWRQQISLDDANSPDSQWKPLTCGDMHKNLYGTTGYEKPSHWCAKGQRALST